jgi:hypothetical protein
VPINFTDVDPEVLADEEASERHRPGLPPALERGSVSEMAQALLVAGSGAQAATSHSETMRRRALAAGDVRRARFWDDVTAAVRRG